MPVRRPRSFHACFTALAVCVAVHVAHVICGVGFGGADGFIDRWLYTIIEALATALLWARVATDRRDRTAWAMFAGYATLWSAGDLGWTLDYDYAADPPFPNWTDAVYIASDLLAYAGVILLLRDRIRPFRASLWLDGLVGGLALGALCATAFLGPVLDRVGGRALSEAVTLAYPVLDVLLLCLVGLAFGVSHWRPGRVWVFLGVALALAAVGDASYSYLEAVGRYDDSSWVNGTWPAAMAALAYAGMSGGARRAVLGDHEAQFAAPAAFATVSLAILVWSQFHAVPLLAALLAAGSLGSAGVRAWLTHRENLGLLRRSRAEALTDGLTGLGNRRRLMLDLDAALGGERAAPSMLVFFDLDGFKGYNDTFGHGAGDALLVRLSGALAAAVAGEGAAYRLGGDEFCVLLDHDVRGESAAVLRAAVALTDEGEGFAITSSYGVVRLPDEADNAGVALQLADERMYDDKGTRRGSTRRQARDLLLQVLKEREPELEEHVDDVGALAVAVGRQLGLGAEALDEIARGAELHDVGKVAVPETILRKPGPLDDHEWAVMRQHTVVGERILAAAPALRPVARLVRSSHERWDGSGYPDGLAGERIPLGARIIAVCDAFDAMRQARPYAPSMTEAAALAELRRCAGTQFDARVVEAFAVVLAQGAGEALRVA
jgi:diguanylate cyclase (GGDEF)-like protein